MRANKEMVGKVKIKKWENTRTRFVAFLDIMGFKDLVAKKEHMEVLQIMTEFLPTIELIQEEYSTKRQESAVKVVTFSDSIILVSDDNSYDAATLILFWIKWVMWGAINKGLPIKGAIAWGIQTDDFGKALHFGKPLIDAQQLQNELFLYGVVLHHTMEKYLIDTNMMDELTGKFIIKCLTPMKTGKITHYLVDWPGFNKDKDRAPVAVSKLYGTVSGSVRQYVDNTSEFVNMINKKDKN
jgi:hypothetical protein